MHIYLQVTMNDNLQRIHHEKHPEGTIREYFFVHIKYITIKNSRKIYDQNATI